MAAKKNQEQCIKITASGHFTVIENELFDMPIDAYEFKVFCYLRKVAGNGSACWQTTRNMAAALGFGRRKLIESIQRLLDLNMLVEVEAPDHLKNPNARSLTVNRAFEWTSCGSPEDPRNADRGSPEDPHSGSRRDPHPPDSWIPTGTAPGTLEEEDPKIDQDPDEEDHPTPPPGGHLCATTVAPSLTPTPDVSTLAQEWRDWALVQQPWLKSASVKAYAMAIRKLMRRHGHDIAQVKAVFWFIKQSDFWSKNAISPNSLLKRSKNNDLYKYENIMSDFQRDSRPGGKLFWAEIDKTLDEVPF